MTRVLSIALLAFASLATGADRETLFESKSITVLGARAIDDYQGNCANEVASRWVDFSGKGEVTWNVTAPKSGRYEVIVAYGSLADSGHFQVTAAGSTLQGDVHETMGLYENKRKHAMNLERFSLQGVLEIPQGNHTVSFRMDHPQDQPVFKLNLLELVPVEYKAAILAERAEAERRRADTDWFVEAQYGLMFHWTSESLPLKGEMKSYQEAVRDFNVPAFAEMVEKTGAAYVFFTAMHADPTFPAPIKEWEEAFPGMTTERDLIGEIADALASRNIKLGLYCAAGPMANVASQEGKRLGKQAYTKRVVTLFEAIGRRYGEKLFGYWIDNWLAVDRWYPTFDYRRYFEALKTGNPQRLIGLNSNIEVSVTPWQEYWAGEANGYARALPGGRYYLRGPAKGLQRHGLIHLERGWFHGIRKMKPDDPRRALIGKTNIPIDPPMYKEARLIDLIEGFVENEGVVTINIKISQEGWISEEAANLMEKVRRRFRQK